MAAPLKRPKNGYMRWLDANRARLVKENPNDNVKDIARKAGEEWAALAKTNKDKKKYNDEAEKAFATYKAEVEAHPERKAKNKSRKKSKAKRAKKDPNKPKRGLTAYMFWLAENRARLNKENPGKKVTEISVIAGEAWDKVKNRKKWEDLAAEDAERYKKEMEGYVAPEGSEGKTKRKKKAEGAPKKALTAYMFWLKENRPRIVKANPGKKVTEISQIAGPEWKAVKNKKKWEDLAKKDKERYETEKTAFEAAEAK